MKGKLYIGNRDDTLYAMTDKGVKIIPPVIWNWHRKYHANDSFAHCHEKAPNWFHRLMQRLILGICWERINK